MVGKVQELLNIQLNKRRELNLSNNENLSTWVYCSFKAARYLAVGSDIYLKQDFFNYPLQEWDSDKLIMGCKQIIYNCAGISLIDTYFEGLSEFEIRNLFELFHFSKIDDIEYIDNEFIKINFCHKMDSRKHTVYCKNNIENNLFEEVYFLISVNEKKIKICETKNNIIKIFTNEHELGIQSEYEYFNQMYPSSKIINRELKFIELNGIMTPVDIFRINTGKIEKELIFDISMFFDKK